MSKASRVGILATALGFVTLLFGLMTGGWGYSSTDLSEVASTVGLLGTALGYVLVRLWFWALH